MLLLKVAELPLYRHGRVESLPSGTCSTWNCLSAACRTCRRQRGQEHVLNPISHCCCPLHSVKVCPSLDLLAGFMALKRGFPFRWRWQWIHCPHGRSTFLISLVPVSLGFGVLLYIKGLTSHFPYPRNELDLICCQHYAVGLETISSMEHFLTSPFLLNI